MTEEHITRRMILNSLGSRFRLQILQALTSAHEPLSVYEISKRSKLDADALIRRNLELLKEVELVTSQDSVRGKRHKKQPRIIRYWSFNWNTRISGTLAKLLSEIYRERLPLSQLIISHKLGPLERRLAD